MSQWMPGMGLSYEEQSDTRGALLCQNCSGQCEQDVGEGGGLWDMPAYKHTHAVIHSLGTE